jgi:hypothetical protein
MMIKVRSEINSLLFYISYIFEKVSTTISGKARFLPLQELLRYTCATGQSSGAILTLLVAKQRGLLQSVNTMFD